MLSVSRSDVGTAQCHLVIEHYPQGRVRDRAMARTRETRPIRTPRFHEVVQRSAFREQERPSILRPSHFRPRNATGRASFPPAVWAIGSTDGRRSESELDRFIRRMSLPASQGRQHCEGKAHLVHHRVEPRGASVRAGRGHLQCRTQPNSAW